MLSFVLWSPHLWKARLIPRGYHRSSLRFQCLHCLAPSLTPEQRGDRPWNWHRPGCPGIFDPRSSDAPWCQCKIATKKKDQSVKPIVLGIIKLMETTIAVKAIRFYVYLCLYTGAVWSILHGKTNALTPHCCTVKWSTSHRRISICFMESLFLGAKYGGSVGNSHGRTGETIN